jgi:hypothetical protein
LVSSKKHTSISLCVVVFLIEALLADIPNPQLFQNKIFIDKLPSYTANWNYWAAFQSAIFLYIHLASNVCCQNCQVLSIPKTQSKNILCTSSSTIHSAVAAEL